MARDYHAGPGRQPSRRRALARAASLLACAALTAPLAGCGSGVQAARLVLTGDSRELRKRVPGSPESSPAHAPLLVLGLDGVDRALLYDLLREGKLPGFARLLNGGVVPAGGAGAFPHVHFDDTLLATMPSSTMVAWTTVFTGLPPAQHGVTGNEYFVRETLKLVAPVPVTFKDSAPTLACFTADAYCSKLIEAPTVYERMRERDPDVLVWVAMQHIHRGADVLLVAERTAFVGAFEAEVGAVVSKMAGQVVGDESTKKESSEVYRKLDVQVARVVTDAIDGDGVTLPDVLTVYFSGTDLYGHIATEGPDEARTTYMREVLDRQVNALADHLHVKGALDDRWVIVTSDHGHTDVIRDEKHALATRGADDPPRVLELAGFRVRPFQLGVEAEADFQSVLAYQGATAFVYLADRSTCVEPGRPCDWRQPPRFEEDVLAAADAFHMASTEGMGVPGMKGTLDMVLARKPRPYAEVDEPFQVYVGKNRLVPIPAWLAANPRPTYRALDARLRDLAVGPRGERAGDVLLIATNGNVDAPEERFYFAEPYESWHGSPSAKDSELPLIVAHPGTDAAAIGRRVKAILGPTPRQQKVSDLMLDLRYGGGPPSRP